jgi:hypothetical protein
MKKVKVHISISEADKRWLDQEALVRDISFSAIVELAIRSHRLSEPRIKFSQPKYPGRLKKSGLTAEDENTIAWIRKLGA